MAEHVNTCHIILRSSETLADLEDKAANYKVVVNTVNGSQWDFVFIGRRPNLTAFLMAEIKMSERDIIFNVSELKF